MDVGILLSFLLFLGFFAGVGLASMRAKQDTTDDYLVAGRGMHPALAALSAVSTWNSGYMFIGFIGFIYLMGYSAIWIGLISTVGQLVAWAWLYKFIQKEGNERGLRSLSSLSLRKQGLRKRNWLQYSPCSSCQSMLQRNSLRVERRSLLCSAGLNWLVFSSDSFSSLRTVTQEVFVPQFGPMLLNPA